MIKEVDGKFCIISHTTEKSLGCYDTKEEAEARLAEIEQYTAESTKILFSKKPIKMPILPAIPCKTVDGRDVTQELIDGVLAYDANVRQAIVALNREDAHGEGNSPSLGKVLRTYIKDDVIVADVLPILGMEDVLPQLAAEAYPDRSIEADWLHIDGNDSKRLYLEAIKLCGSQRPALNLPAVSFSTKPNSKINYTVSLTGGPNTMPDDKPQDEQPTPKPPQPPKPPAPPAEDEPDKFAYGIAQPIAKVREKEKADFAMREQNYLERIQKLEEQNLNKELDHWSKSPKMLRKLPQFARANAINLLRAEYTGQKTATFHFAKGPENVELGDGWKALLESLPDTLISTGQIAAHIDNAEFDEVPVTSQEKQSMMFSKMRTYAKANNLDLSDRKVFEKVEREILQENPELREGQ